MKAENENTPTKISAKITRGEKTPGARVGAAAGVAKADAGALSVLPKAHQAAFMKALVAYADALDAMGEAPAKKPAKAKKKAARKKAKR